MKLLMNKTMATRLIVLVCSIFLITTLNAQAAVYKWTDAQGKVHYSDKKVDEKASEQKVQFGSMPQAPIVALAQPQKYNAAKPSKWLAVTKPELSVIESNAQTGKQFTFYFGGDCVSPTSLSLNDFKKRYVKYLKDSTDMQEAVIRQLDIYNYRNLHFKTDGPMRDLDNNEGYILQLDLLDIKVNACVRKLDSPQDSGLLDQFAIRAFDKTNAWVKLRWAIKNSTGEKVFASNISEGAVNDIDGLDAPVAGVFKTAYRDAVINMIADPEFMKTMEPAPVSIAGAASALAGTPKIEAKPRAQTLAGLPGKMQNTYVARANFANALTSVNPLRIAISNYYAENGQWPAYFSDIGVDSSTLREPGIVDSVEIRLGGTLHVVLSAAAFGAGHYFQMAPDTRRGTMIDWNCKTTLDKSLWVGSCIGL